ncbi:MAG TPA: carboxypeptidase-like regulatory domain-containing protein [Candidatus Nitrosotenuis sp.]|nr:carboxypeptidase-like regulatory domain-containing protein [Candidatus Nitrosotenuis sp.]
MNRLAVFSALLAALLLAATSWASAATLWDFMIKAEFEEPHIRLNEKPVISGVVLDHASKPVPGAEIKIRFAGVSASTTTGDDGKFRYEFEQQPTSGVFSVVVSATKGEHKGFARTTLKVGNEFSTFDELYYKQLSQNKTMHSLAPAPYEVLKLKNYEKFLEGQNKKLQKQYDIEARKLAIEEKRNLAQDKLEQALQERPVGPGTYGGLAYKDYMSKLDPRIKNTIASQLNYTKQLHEEARQAMKEILDNGGSLQDARKVYFEKLSITKNELLEVNDKNNTKNYSKTLKSEDKKINSKKVKGLTLNKNLK